MNRRKANQITGLIFASNWRTFRCRRFDAEVTERIAVVGCGSPEPARLSDEFPLKR